MFHYVTEEGILAATEYPNMNEYQQRTHQTKVQLRQICEVAIDKNDPQMLLQFLGEWWQKHLVFHDEFSPYLSGWSGKYCRLSHIDLDWI
jgi:hemerythrin